MAILSDCFCKFLVEIRPTKNQTDDLIKGHTILRERLMGYKSLKDIIECTFLQGSYKRATLVRPQNDKRSDVDVVVVTNLDREKYPNPDKAMDLFVSFLREYYINKYKRQGRSFGIKLSYVDLDLVITSAPTLVDKEKYKNLSDSTIEKVSDSWKAEQLWIPDRDAHEWKPTNPLEQMEWTKQKNKSTNGHYVNVVKAIKWWQRVYWSNDRPKGYPLEHLTGQCCPDGITSVAEGVAKTLENIILKGSTVPYFESFGVFPSENVFARILQKEYSEFFEHAKKAEQLAKKALDDNNEVSSSQLWRELFGEKFPLKKQGPFVTPKSEQVDSKPRRYA